MEQKVSYMLSDQVSVIKTIQDIYETISLKTKDHLPNEIDLIKLTNSIREKQSKLELIPLDQVGDDLYKKIKSDKDKLKFRLPALIPSMICNGNHNIDNFKKYTNIFCIDLDHLKNVESIFQSLKTKKDVFLMFRSPSGDGLKIFYKTGLKIEYLNDFKVAKCYHEAIFIKKLKELKNEFDLDQEIDIKCKNINRLCYLPYDPNVYYNENSKPYSFTAHEFNTILSLSKKKSVTTIVNSKEVANNLLVDEFYDFLKKEKKNLFSDYNEWIKMGWRLIKYFNKDKDISFKYFDLLSSTSDNYNNSTIQSDFEKLYNSYDETKIGSIRILISSLVKDNTIPSSYKTLVNLSKVESFDIVDMISEEGVYLVEDKITKEKYIHYNDQLRELTDGNFLDVFIHYNKKYGITKNRLEEVIYATQNIKEINIIEDLLNSFEYKEEYDVEIDKFFECVEIEKINEEDKFVEHSILTSWMLGVFDNLFTTRKYKFILVFKGKSDVGKTYLINDVILKPFINIEYRGLKLNYVQTNFHWCNGNDSKDDLISLSTMPFIVDDELSATSKADIENIKKCTSEVQFKLRKSYGKHAEKYDRISSFIASSNQDTIFYDDTNAIRFLGFEILDIDRTKLAEIDFKKVWSHAWHLYKLGERSSGIEDISKLMFKLNSANRIVSKDEQIIDVMLEKSTDNLYSMLEIIDGIKLKYPDFNPKSQNFGNYMKNCGFEKKKQTKCTKYYCEFKNKKDFIFDITSTFKHIKTN